MSTSESIYRAVKSCYYNVHNILIQLPHPKTQRLRGHYILSIFTTISVPNQLGLDACPLLG
jgi:hypothetical protein